jgi:hypothetical protein
MPFYFRFIVNCMCKVFHNQLYQTPPPPSTSPTYTSTGTYSVPHEIFSFRAIFIIHGPDGPKPGLAEPRRLHHLGLVAEKKHPTQQFVERLHGKRDLGDRPPARCAGAHLLRGMPFLRRHDRRAFARKTHDHAGGHLATETGTHDAVPAQNDGVELLVVYRHAARFLIDSGRTDARQAELAHTPGPMAERQHVPLPVVVDKSKRFDETFHGLRARFFVRNRAAAAGFERVEQLVKNRRVEGLGARKTVVKRPRKLPVPAIEGAVRHFLNVVGNQRKKRKRPRHAAHIGIEQQVARGGENIDGAWGYIGVGISVIVDMAIAPVAEVFDVAFNRSFIDLEFPAYFAYFYSSVSLKAARNIRESFCFAH